MLTIVSEPSTRIISRCASSVSEACRPQPARHAAASPITSTATGEVCRFKGFKLGLPISAPCTHAPSRSIAPHGNNAAPDPPGGQSRLCVAADENVSRFALACGSGLNEVARRRASPRLWQRVKRGCPRTQTCQDACSDRYTTDTTDALLSWCGYNRKPSGRDRPSRNPAQPGQRKYQAWFTNK